MSEGHERRPTAFISYSRAGHGNEAWVRALWTRLRGDGIDCTIDQSVTGAPPEGWRSWMNRQIAEADYVIVLWDSDYVQPSGPSDAPSRGAEWEYSILEHASFSKQSTFDRVLVITRPGRVAPVRPHWLDAASRFEIEDAGSAAYDELYRKITNQPRIAIPPLGPLRMLPPEEQEVASEADEIEPDAGDEHVDELERALRDRRPELCGRFALQSEDATEFLVERLSEIDPDDLRILIERTVRRFEFSALELVVMVEVLFLVVGLRFASGEKMFDEAGTPLLHRLWDAMSRCAARRWERHPAYPRTFDVRKGVNTQRWWGACWSWSLCVPRPEASRPDDFWPTLFPGWEEDRGAGAFVRERKAVDAALGSEPSGPISALLLSLGVAIWQAWGEPPLREPLPWPFVVAALGSAVSSGQELDPTQRESLEGALTSRGGETVLELIRSHPRWCSAAAKEILGPDDGPDARRINELVHTRNGGKVLDFVLEHLDEEQLTLRSKEEALRLSPEILGRLPVATQTAVIADLLESIRDPGPAHDAYLIIDTVLGLTRVSDEQLAERLFAVSREWDYSPIQQVWSLRPAIAEQLARQWWAENREASRYWFTEAHDRRHELLKVIEDTPTEEWPQWVPKWLVHLGRSRGVEATLVHALVVRHDTLNP